MTLGTLRVGHPEIDAQHAAILHLLGDIRSTVEKRDLHGARRALEALWDASVANFATEEALMEEHAYPERNPHRTAHHLFLEDLKAVVGALSEDGLTDQVAGWAVKRVPEWIVFHVETNDAPLARYLARRAASRAAAGGSADPDPPVPRGRDA